MPKIKLTNRSVDALAPKPATFIAYDADLPGFGVRVTPNGAKSWIVEYRASGGGRSAPNRRLTLGKRSLLTAEQARGQARDALARARLGGDPAGERAEQRSAPTFAEIAEDFMEQEVRTKKAKNTISLYEIYLRVHLLPKLGAKRARDVSYDDVNGIHARLGLRAKPTANRVVIFIGGVYNWASADREGKRNPYGLPKGFNPGAGIKRFAETAREQFLKADELARLGEAIREAETVGIPYAVDTSKPKAKHAPKEENRRTIISPHAAAALRLLLFTGARLREILHLKWDQIDFERGILLLPKSKTRKKTIVLNAPALAILAELPRLGAYVIAGQSAGGEDEKPRADLDRPWIAVRARAGLGGLRIHDLRHSFASVGVGGGMGLPIIGKLLGHRHTATTERYAHLDTDPLRNAADRIGAHISAAMGEAGEGGAVVPFKRSVQ